MMETKLCVALCALLLINFGPAAHGDDNAAVSSPSKSTVDDETAPEVPPTESVPTSSLEPFNHPATSSSLNNTDPSSRVTSILSNDTTAEGQSLPLPEAKNENGTAIISPSQATVPEIMTDATDETTSQPPIPPPGSVPPTPTPTPTPTPAPTPASTTSTSPAHTTHAAPLATTTTTPPLTSTSHHPELPPHDFTTPSHRPTHPKTHPASSSTSAPAPEPPKTDTPTDTSTTTTCRSTTKAQSSSTSSTSPPHEEPPSSESPIMVTSVQNTSPYGHIEPITEAHPKSTTTTTTQSSPSSQAKAHAADNPSQLNVGGDTTMVRDSPTLDPLLAGLVSAFIITAVIITMLLFLKLRRRDNRPEFRRLQDLPMDDMMEDTPLSMYNY